MMCNNPKLDLVNKFGEILSMALIVYGISYTANKVCMTEKIDIEKALCPINFLKVVIWNLELEKS